LRRLLKLLVFTLTAAGLAALVAAVVVVSGGISARQAPTRVEAAVAGRLRALAIPRAAHNRTNPVPVSDEVFRSGMAHFADHCASCHANDGSGNTETGRGLYPRTPDVRQPATQALSDGDLFYIIENGVRFTGMPAWGTGSPDSELATWHLVQFIRGLPKLTEHDLARMRELNPKSADEWRAEEEARRFLEPNAAAKPAVPAHRRTGGQQ
jgi:mono/diheme cytochrome c family protein